MTEPTMQDLIDRLSAGGGRIVSVAELDGAAYYDAVIQHRVAGEFVWERPTVKTPRGASETPACAPVEQVRIALERVQRNWTDLHELLVKRVEALEIQVGHRP